VVQTKKFHQVQNPKFWENFGWEIWTFDRFACQNVIMWNQQLTAWDPVLACPPEMGQILLHRGADSGKIRKHSNAYCLSSWGPPLLKVERRPRLQYANVGLGTALEYAFKFNACQPPPGGSAKVRSLVPSAIWNAQLPHS